MKRASVFLRAWTAVVLVMVAGSLPAGTVYRWVDDQGRTHFSDTVPAEYRNRARPLSLPSTEPTDEDRQKALERAERDREQANTGAGSRSAGRPDRERTPLPSVGAPGKRPERTPDEDTDCETWQNLYQESLECFGPYRTARGGIKPEAFENCTEVREPPPRCRQRLP